MIPGKQYTPKDILAIVMRYKWLLVCPPLAGLFIALVISAGLPNSYESDMMISIIPQRVPDSFVQSTVTLRIEERLDTISNEAKSRGNLEKIISDLNLYPQERESKPIDQVVAQMRSALKVELEAPRRGPRGPEPVHAFHVKFSYPDPELAAKVTQRVGQMFIERNAVDRGALAEATNDFLEGELADARQRLEAHEAKMESFRRLHGNELPTQLQTNLQVIQSTQMQVQAMVEANARDKDRRLMIERLYNEVRQEPLPPSPAAVAQAPTADPNAVAAGTARQQLTAARANYDRLALRLRPEHPDMVRAQRTIRELEAQVAATPEPAAATGESASAQASAPVSAEDAARRSRLRELRAEMESLDRQTTFREAELRGLQTKIGEYQRRTEAVPGLESEWTALSRDYDTLVLTYRNLLQKSEASKVAVNLEERQIGEQFRVIEAARVPSSPTGPFRLQISAVGFGAGLLLGALVGALLAFRDTSFRSESDVFQALALPVLAIVPTMNGERELQAIARRRWILSGVTVATLLVCGYVTWSMKLWKFVA